MILATCRSDVHPWSAGVPGPGCPGPALMSVSGGRVFPAEAGHPVVRLPALVDPASDVDGLGDAVHVAGVLVVVPADPGVPVFGLIDRDPVPDFGLAVVPRGPPFLLDAGV